MELDETETLPSALTPSLRIRLYKDAKAWHYLREILFRRDLAGNINLCELKTELAVDGQLYVCKVTSTKVLAVTTILATGFRSASSSSIL